MGQNGRFRIILPFAFDKAAPNGVVLAFEQDFVGCFSTCGGTVTPRTVCTANCEKVPPAAQISGGRNAPIPR